MHLFAEITSASKMVYNRGFTKQMHKRKVIKINTDDATPTNTPRQTTVSPTPPHLQTINRQTCSKHSQHEEKSLVIYFHDNGLMSWTC